MNSLASKKSLIVNPRIMLEAQTSIVERRDSIGALITPYKFGLPYL